ncbi:zinc finger protein 501-like [Physella acuta]|uniref:zinc finger protein 501-like n=1 Tax=Physella acuta TaxID=109671 RepID=UPI0027DCE794|nr:zinc finger protein 501-like [Physella acuta]XP_059148430.1 zinc finger protein 501-like [Physella acuta]XP_059148431.1 zinc finger protein 501-like [Physella acuta]
MREQVGHCDICSRTFSSFQRLQKHWNKTHTEEQAINCCFCDFIVAEEPLFAKHKKEFHPNYRMVCEFCAFTTRKWSKLKKHHTEVHVALYKENIATCLHNDNFKNKSVISSCKYPTDYRSTSSTCGNFEVKCLIQKEKENVSSTNEKTAELYHNKFKTCDELQLNQEHKLNIPQKSQSLTWQKCECALENCKACQLPHNDKEIVSEPLAEISVCDICQKSFKSVSHLTSHKLVHTPMQCYICCHCDRHFSIAKEYDLHLTTHFRYKPFKCELCEKCYADKQYLKAHIRLHNGESIHKCEKSNYVTPHLSTFKKHQLIHSNPQADKCVEKLHTCDICQKCFYSLDHFLSQLVHIPTKLYICGHCDRGFNFPDDYDLHLTKTHYKYKPFKCTLCEKSFTKKGTLRVHTSKHTMDLLFKCSKCEYTTNKKTPFSVHQRNYMNTKPYKCNACDYSTASEGTLVNHLRIHSGEKPFCCNLRDKRFSRRLHLLSHKRHIHLI